MISSPPFAEREPGTACQVPSEPRCKACRDHGEVAVLFTLPNGNASFRLERCTCVGFEEDPR